MGTEMMGSETIQIDSEGDLESDIEVATLILSIHNHVNNKIAICFTAIYYASHENIFKYKCFYFIHVINLLTIIVLYHD